MTEESAPVQVKSCATCPSFLGSADLQNQVSNYGAIYKAPTCPVKSKLLGGPNAPEHVNEKIQEAVARTCNMHGKQPPRSQQKSGTLTVALPMPQIGDPTKNYQRYNDQPKSCRTCKFYVPPKTMQEEIGMTAGLCARKGEIVAEQNTSKVAKNCTVGESLASGGNVADLQQHYEDMLADVMILPELRPALQLGKRIGANLPEPEAPFVDPQDYPTDAPVTPEDKAHGIKAWRKFFNDDQSKSVLMPVFDIDFFSEEEQKKIPRTGDEHHAEMYKDHQNLAFKCAVIWKLEETPALHGVAGTGKGHPVDTKVLTPEGWRRVGDLRVGDEIFGSDGQATKVTGVFPRGVLNVNRVTMTDGSSVLVDDDHLWKVKNHGLRVPGTKDKRGLDQVISTSKLKKSNLRIKSGYRYSIPLVEPVQYPERTLPVHPYVLGVLLANGALTSGEALYSSNDQHVIDRVGALIDQVERTPTPTRRHVIKSNVWRQLGQLGLQFKLSGEKFIPSAYLHASESQRRDLLAALLDCDGSAARGKTRYHTTSERLAAGVVSLVRSLGGTATKQYSSRDDEITVNISSSENYFTTPAKAALRDSVPHRNPARKIVSIEDAGEAEVRCISVAADDQLYVTENYIVTHNTEFFRYMAWLMGLPFERVSITASSELDDLAGSTHYTPEKGTFFEMGRIPRAWGKPCIQVIDEPNVGSPAVWQFIRPMTDNAKQLVLDMNEGQVVDRHKHSYLGMAMNPAWDFRNVGAEVISDADGSRLMHIFVEFPDEKIEREILRKRCELDGFKISPDQLNKIMAIAADLRALSKEGALPITWGIRPQIKVARALAWFSYAEAYRLAAADYLEPEAQEVILDKVNLKTN